MHMSTQPGFSELLDSFGKHLGSLDHALLQFKEHPMYAEWLDNDEVNVTKCICNEDDCKECNDEADEIIDDLIAELYE